MVPPLLGKTSSKSLNRGEQTSRSKLVTLFFRRTGEAAEVFGLKCNLFNLIPFVVVVVVVAVVAVFSLLSQALSHTV